MTLAFIGITPKLEDVATNHAEELIALFFEDSFDALKEWERVCLKIKVGDPLSVLEPVFRCAHNIKGGAGLVGMQKLYEKLHDFEDYLVKVRDLNLPLNRTVVDAILRLEQLLRNWLEQARYDLTYAPDTTQIESEFEAIINSKVQAVQVQPTSSKYNPTLEARPSVESPKSDETLRVMASRLDHLIQLVGEMSLHQAILERASRESTLESATVRNVIDIKSKLTQDLQDAALNLRMIPIEGLFQKIERVVRETASQLNKSVTVFRKGDDVTLDKLVVDRMLDPLIHIARNALDHGIETPEQRTAKGKSPEGNILLSAENNTGGVILVFEDDGNGIDPERVFRKALEKGLINVDTELSDLAKQQLIFLPGLSTASEVSTISGRGVGMDVVADMVGKMGGRVDLRSTPNEGTCFTMTLPTNLSILDALVVKVDGSQYAIPNQELSEVVNLSELNIERVNAGAQSVINLRGRVVPIENMSAFLSSSQTSTPVDSSAARPRRHNPGVVIQYRDEFLALAVDQVVGQQQIFVRPVIDSLANIKFFGGSTILSDGEPSIILNLTEIARHYFEIQ